MEAVEKMIYDAMAAVEEMPADELLTSAILDLRKAMTKVSDYIDKEVRYKLKVGDYLWDAKMGIAIEITSEYMLAVALERKMTKATAEQIEKFNGKDYDLMIPVDRFEKCYAKRKEGK